LRERELGGDERGIVEEAMKRPGDKKKEGERERERDEMTVVKWMKRAKERREKQSMRICTCERG